MYTERELYEYFERVVERSKELLVSFERYWEREWKRHKVGLMDNNEKGTCFDFRDFDEEEIEEYKQDFMEMYENRITKGMDDFQSVIIE